MEITYCPEGEPAQTWTFDPSRVRQSQAEMIEKRFGGTFDEWYAGVRAGGAKARRVMLWHLMARQHPGYRYEDVPDFYLDEFRIAYSSAEIREVLDGIKKAPMEAEQREMLIAALAADLTAAEAREAAAGVAPEGKAR